MAKGKNMESWEKRLDSYERESQELRERARSLEENIGRMEAALYRKDITTYRAGLVEAVRKTFIDSFKERETLPSDDSAKDDWEQLSGKLRTCIIILKTIDTEEAGICSSALELKECIVRALEDAGQTPSADVAGLLSAGIPEGEEPG